MEGDMENATGGGFLHTQPLKPQYQQQGDFEIYSHINIDVLTLIKLTNPRK